MQELSEILCKKIIFQDFEFRSKFKPKGKFIPKLVPLILQCLKIPRGQRMHRSNYKRDNRN